MNDKSLESVLNEQRVFPPSDKFVRNARITAADVVRLQEEADRDYEAYWARMAREQLTWAKPFTEVLDDRAAPNYRWFTDGELNVSANCLDANLAERADKTAIVFEGEGGDRRQLTYRELTQQVCRFANGLLSLGVGDGDRVVIYMPMVPEAVIAMQACARIGAVHSVVFGGFSANSLRDRIIDAGAKVVITADGGHRGGQIVPLKEATDKAVADGCDSVEHVVVLKRADCGCAWQAGRDVWWADVIEGQPDSCEPKPMNAEHPLFLLYTSGSTGKPKGIQHASAGYLLHAKITNQWVFDLRDDDVFWCTADVGWITGHTYVAYGPLAAGATIVIYEGAPTYPDAGRFWKHLSAPSGRHHFLYGAYGYSRAHEIWRRYSGNSYDLSKIRLLGTVGEPINPEAWIWYHRVDRQGTLPHCRYVVADGNGRHHDVSPLPGVTATKPGSCTRCRLPGIDVSHCG